MVNFPRIGLYAGQRSGGQPLVDSGGAVSWGMCAKFARYPIATLDLNMALARPDVVSALRQLNPEQKLLGYHLMTHWWLPETFVPRPDDKTFNAEWHKTLQATDGFMSGAPVGYVIDWSNEETAYELTSLITRHIAGRLFDGVFLDYCAPLMSWTGWPPATPERDEIRMFHFQQLVSKIREAQPGCLVYANGTGAESVGADGIMQEGFPDVLTTLDQAFTGRDGDWLKSEGSGTGDPRRARYLLGVSCLSNAIACYGTDHFPVEPYEATWWFPEYSVTPEGNSDPYGLHLGWLGEATTDREMLTNTGVWRRDFQNGTVIVNTTQSPVTIDMHRTYWKRIDDKRLQRNVYVPPQDAVFLVGTRK